MKKLLLASATLVLITTITLQNASAQNWLSPANVSTNNSSNSTNASPNAGGAKNQNANPQNNSQNQAGKKEAVQERNMERVRARLGEAIGRMIRHLNNLRNRVQNHPNIDDEAEEQILARLDGYTDWLEEKENELEGLSTLEELRNHREQIRGYWAQIRGEAKYITGQILVARAKHFAQRLEEAVEVTEEKIYELKIQGKDTSSAEDLISQAKTHLAEAELQFESALATFGNIETIQSSEELFQTGQGYLRKARQELVDALHLIKQAAVEVKKLSRPPASIQPTATPSGEEED